MSKFRFVVPLLGAMVLASKSMAGVRLAHCTTSLPFMADLCSSRNIILGSASPRRLELMHLVGFKNIVVVSSDFEETLDKNHFSRAEDYCIATCEGKANSIVESGKLPSEASLDSVLICADTIVEINNCILEKPVDRIDAFRMLHLLSDKWHKVHTAVTIFATRHSGTQQFSELVSYHQTTEVKFVKLTQRDIEAYLDTEEPYDKAGSYGIQGIGAQFVEEIKGCYFNVMGLPLSSLSRNLNELYRNNSL